MAVGWGLLIQRSFSVMFFRLFRLIFIGIQRIHWEVNGTARKIREAADPKYYERSAHVLDIFMERHFCEQQNHVVQDFICVHNRFENPQFVIDNEHVTLYAVDEHTATFSVARDKDMRLWKTEFDSFMRLSQRRHCNQLIVVPLSVFHRMAETIGDPKAKLIYIFNVARCGSTLLTQVLEYTGRCVAVSEPDAPNFLAMKFRKEGDSPELRQLARDVIRWECRPYPSMQPPPLAYALKLTAPAAVALELFVGMFPNSHYLFMYRDVVKVAKSLYRIAYTLPSIWLLYKFGRLSGSLSAKAVESMGIDGRDYRHRLPDNIYLGVLMYCLLTRVYVNMRRRGTTDVVGIRYEDLAGNSAESLRRILEHCGLPVELVEPGIRGLEVDSQRNSVIAKSIIGSLPEPELTPEAAARANELLRMSELPLIGEKCFVEGTITCGKS